MPNKENREIKDNENDLDEIIKYLEDNPEIEERYKEMQKRNRRLGVWGL